MIQAKTSAPSVGRLVYFSTKSLPFLASPMDVTQIPQLVRNSNRFREVVTVLAKHGLASWMKAVRLDWVQRIFSAEKGPVAPVSLEARVRLALTELGPTFIKMGQILSTRPDLIGFDLANELALLRSSTPADPPQRIREMVLAELGASVDELFAEFDDAPLASASIGQVHKAKLKTGEQVVVKVQHYGIEDKMRTDLDILYRLSEIAHEVSSQLKPYRPVETAREFGNTLQSELDFRREQRNLTTFRRNLRNNRAVHVPKPYPELSSRRVLTMEYLEGFFISDTERLEAEGVDTEELSRQGAMVFLDMIFRDGFYQADPHPGNLIVMPDHVIGLLDAGMVGRIDERLREEIESVLLAVVEQDAQRISEIVVRLGSAPPDFEETALRSDIDDFVVQYSRQSLGDFDLCGALRGMMTIIRKHRVVFPTKIAMLLKVLIMLEGSARQLNPSFNLAELLHPFSLGAFRRRLSPARLWRKMESAYRDWNRLFEIFPRDLADILHRVKQGSFDVHLDHRRLDTSVNRLVMGIISAALFMGSAMLWSNNTPPVIYDVSVVGAVGCAVAVSLGWIVIRAIKKSGDIQKRD